MKVLLLGIGNILFGDEGVGVHLSNQIKLNYKIASPIHSLDIIDGGTLAQSLIPLITDYDYVIVLDCINASDGKVGDVYFFDFANVPDNLNWQGSAHEVEMLQTLKMIEILGDLPPVKIAGIIPHIVDCDAMFELSNEIKNGAELMKNQVFSHLQDMGFCIERINNYDLQEVANYSYKGY